MSRGTGLKLGTERLANTDGIFPLRRQELGCAQGYRRYALKTTSPTPRLHETSVDAYVDTQARSLSHHGLLGGFCPGNKHRLALGPLDNVILRGNHVGIDCTVEVLNPGGTAEQALELRAHIM